MTTHISGSRTTPLPIRVLQALTFGVPLLLATAACGQSGPATNAAAATSAQPDLSGVWMAFTVENPAGGGTTPRYTAEGAAKLDAFVAEYHEIPEPGAGCVGTGMPAVMLSLVSYPIEFAQNASRIVMVAELEMQVRRVFIDGRGHPEDAFPSGVGHSIGTWEGDTLVVDTTLLEEWPLRPWPRSEDMHIVERMHLTKLGDITARPTGFVATLAPPESDDVLVVDITVTDPTYYAGPQRRIAYYQRMTDADTSEYACSRGLWYDALEEQRIE
jgi:hypothetical protein